MTRSPTAEEFIAALARQANPDQAKILQRFFKTGKGQYAEGDLFIGVKVPVIRTLVRQFKMMPAKEAAKLVRSEIHEHRLAGLLLWVQTFTKADEPTRREILDLYLRHTKHINNWDLVDLSAPQIVGGSFEPQDISFLQTLAESPLIWERRIAILATLSYIRQGIFTPTLQLCTMLLQDKHDLMHKACGWMLREVGKRDRKTLSGFLDKHAATMPRTMLRYAIEHYCEMDRRKYMTMGKQA